MHMLMTSLGFQSRKVGSGVDVKGVDYELLPFASGQRGCLGMVLGLMQVQYELV